MRTKVIVTGFMAGIPISGVVWQHLHYIVGLQRLGYEVFYIEDSARLPYDLEKGITTEDYSNAARILSKLAHTFGFEDHWAYCARFRDPVESAGLSLERVRQLYREAEAVFNICGAQELHEDILENHCLIYVESDPAVVQIKVDQGDEAVREVLQKHHHLFTFGENIGTERFPIPLHGFKWLPTRQPVVTDFWRTDNAPQSRAAFTTIANLRTAGVKDVVWRGERYLWSKLPEFQRFLQVPEQVRASVEVASDIKDPDVARRLTGSGWLIVPAETVSNDHEAYRRYIKNSRAELTMAKDQYVRLHTGWFSDRSACYLAAGRPVITQATDIEWIYGQRKGLHTFTSYAEIKDAVNTVAADYAASSADAFELAREFFEAERVLKSMIDRIGLQFR